MTYYPYLRGRMYDLLALKELCESDQLGPNIIPIIEPVRDSKDLQKTVQTFLDHGQSFSVVANPQVSVYGLNDTKLYPLADMSNVNNFLPSAILAADFSTEYLKSDQETLLIAKNYQLLKAYQDTELLKKVTHVLIPEEARLHEIVGSKAVSLTDPLTFVRHVENYNDLPDEYFQPASWYRQLDNYNGFGDYSMVGSVYFDKGMPSRAIALHIIYVTSDGTLRIHHFVSDSNETMRGQKEKFFEALNKLDDWSTTNLNGINNTSALQELLSYTINGKFPGLGMIKKLSLMHHFQLMKKLFEFRNNNMHS
ncbi:sce7725 family protein [Companilactobacillus keshanensis]|uniref:Sce7725 family protein n=1 Tax=Companilactobacillus keshanensis TaxID=2486003 RepID=A0ABW4BYW0_9LACO|nr:sce7725 family protein [Companilactobacillus keshanensis]